MPDLKRFQENVTIYRKRGDNAEGRPHTQEELAKEIGLSAKELGHRLNGNGRSPLTKANILKIVETLAAWETLSLHEAEELLRSMDYPLDDSLDWQRVCNDFFSPLAQSVQNTSFTGADTLRKKTASPQDSDARSLERALYLQYVIQTNQWLMLPGGREVPLEHLYVSLRADEMHAKERQAEHTLYLQEVAAFAQEAQARLPDPYSESAALRKVIVRHPKMFMLDARNWPRYFGKREQDTLTLAEVVKHHQQVVLLGDPGSGKTTLGKWLVLQFARAFAGNDTQVRVLADLVQPGAEPTKETEALDLGPVKLPVLVSIAQYARTRKPKEQQDSGLTLYEYLRSGRFLSPLRLPYGLSQEAAGILVGEAVGQGQTLIVLDGLDEVSDSLWRRKIMEAVRRFLQEWCLELAREEHSSVSEQIYLSDRTGNQVVITSRPVGYQFDPLVDLPHYTVEEMEKQAITAFCHAWMQHVAHPLAPPEETSRWAEQLDRAIFSQTHPGVRSMAGNPLLLTIMAQLSWKTRPPDGVRALPIRRVTLFEEAARMFYDQREAFWGQAGITPLRLTLALGAVAAALHDSETAGFATEEDVRKQLGSVLMEKEQVEAVLNAAREVSGFLIARGEGVYGFLHRAMQEYFAAQHLVSQSEQATSTIMAHALNPTWREPVVLAFGLMSHPRYSEESLAALFTALLDLPDPAGSVLPRRELLAVAACAECERVPDGVGRRLAQGLLSAYASLSESGASGVLQQRIRKALVLCQRLPTRARMEVEEVLCAAVQAEEVPQRFAAVDLIIETQWDAPAIAEALVVAWRTHADPAGSLLVALAGLQERQPGSFHERLLPLKRRIAEKPSLWEYANAHTEWKHLLQILYLPRSAPFVLEQVNRDSPLTNEIMMVLEQAVFDSDALLQFRQHLHFLASQPGTALARDAALALSATGERNWIKAWGEHVRGQERLARPVLAALAFFYDRALAIDLAIDLAIGIGLDRALAVEADLELAIYRALPFVEDLELALNLEPSTNDLALDRDLALADILALDGPVYIDIDRNRANDRARVLDRVLDRNRARALDRALVFDLDLDLDLDSNLAQLGFGFALGFDLDFDLERALALDHERDLDLDHTLLRDLDLDLVRDLDLDLDRLDEIEQRLRSTKQRWQDDADLVLYLDAALIAVARLKENPFIGKVWVTLVTTYQEARKDESSRSRPAVPQITPESLPRLVKHLVSSDDEQRRLAKEALTVLQQASTLGKALIESLVQQSQQFSGDGNERDKRQVKTHLSWALKQITFDQPDWIQAWINEASQIQEETPAALILEHIHKVTPETFEALVQALPTTSPHVRKRLLKAFKGLVRAEQIPLEHLPSFTEQMLGWLGQETDDTMRWAMIEVLGAWREQETAYIIGMSLLKRLEIVQREQEESTLSLALAHLARRQPALREPAHAMLLQKTQTCGAALACLYTGMGEPSEDFSFSIRTNRKEKYQRPQSVSADMLLSQTQKELGDLARCFNAFLEAGVDDAPWDEKYHDLLVSAAQHLLERIPHTLALEVLRSLLERLHQALETKDWPTRRMALALVAACAETMPTTLRQAGEGKLEPLIVRGTVDAESYNSRRFALTALSYLRTVTAAVIPALLAGCQDTEKVQRDAIDAVGRFQIIEGDLLPALLPALTGESASTAYAVARLLGALGTSTARMSVGLHERIITALVEALKGPHCQRTVTIAGKDKGTLENALYDVLLRVAGWIG